MELTKYRKQGQTLVRPVNESDMGMFKHCTFGVTSISFEYYVNTVRLIMRSHKIRPELRDQI